jgi:hypothetical protein
LFGFFILLFSYHPIVTYTYFYASLLGGKCGLRVSLGFAPLCIVPKHLLNVLDTSPLTCFCKSTIDNVKEVKIIFSAYLGMKPRNLSLFLSLRYRIIPIIKLTKPAINNITPKTRPPKLVRSSSPFSFKNGKLPKNR